MKHIISPEKLKFSNYNKPSIFLAGSIDNGSAVDWQNIAAEKLRDEDVILFNPRRADWHKEAGENDIREQIYWELDALEAVDSIIINFIPSSLAPISLLELGLFSNSRKVVVVCPKGYWRYTNVSVVCSRYNIFLTDDLEIGLNQAVLLANKNFQKLHEKT